MNRVLGITLVCLAASLATAAAAQASVDLAISQAPSAEEVAAGAAVTIPVTITNRGTEGFEQVFVNLFSLRGHGLGANNPYQSVSATQGSCKDESGSAFGSTYHSIVCELGALAAGASARITAVVQVNESMNHIAALIPNPYEGGFSDADNSNNESVVRISASKPPIVTGSKRITLSGLPAGCVSKDFTLGAVARAKGVKKMAASMFLGQNAEGEGLEWRRSKPGSRLTITVPASRLAPELGAVYKLKLKAKRGRLGPLKKTVLLEVC